MKKRHDPKQLPNLVDYLPTIYDNLKRSHAAKHKGRFRFMQHYSWLVGCQLRFNLTDSEVATLLADLCNMNVEAVQRDILRFQKWRRKLGYRYRLHAETEMEQVRPPDTPMFLFLFLPMEDDHEIIVTHLEDMYAAVYERFGRRKANLWLWCQVLASAVPFATKHFSKWWNRILAGGGAAWLSARLHAKEHK